MTRTSALGSEGERVLGSGVPVSWIRSVASICRSLGTLTQLLTIALCVGCCVEQKATEV